MLPVVYVYFPLASCVSHVPSPNDLATYRATCEAWSGKETTQLKYGQFVPDRILITALTCIFYRRQNKGLIDSLSGWLSDLRRCLPCR
jgi:hypothetical protein